MAVVDSDKNIARELHEDPTRTPVAGLDFQEEIKLPEGNKFRNRICQNLPTFVLELLRKYSGELGLAGGWIRDSLAGDFPNDIDLFCLAKTDVRRKAIAESVSEDIQGYLVTNPKDFNPTPDVFKFGFTFQAAMYTSLDNDIQVIHQIDGRDLYSPANLIEQFNYTVNAAVMYVNGLDELVLRFCDDLPDDLGNKYLKPVVYMGKRGEREFGSMRSILRAENMISRGYQDYGNVLQSALLEGFARENGLPPSTVDVFLTKLNKARVSIESNIPEYVESVQ